MNIQCPDCGCAPTEPQTTMRYGDLLRIFCERCQRWFVLPEKDQAKAA